MREISNDIDLGGLFMNKTYKLFIILSCALALFPINTSAESLVVSSEETTMLTKDVTYESVYLAGTIDCGEYTLTATTLEVTDDATISGNVYVASLKLTGGNLQLSSGSTLTITDDASASAITTSDSHYVCGGSVVWNSMAGGTEYTLPIGCDGFNGTFSFTPSSTIDSWTFSCASNSLDIDYDNGKVASYYWSIKPSETADYNVSLPYSDDLEIDSESSNNILGVITATSSSSLWNVSSRPAVSNSLVASTSAISGSASEEMYVSLGTLVNKVWLGTNSTSLTDASNWDNGEMPTASDVVVVSSALTNAFYIYDSDGVVQFNEVHLKKSGAYMIVENGRLIVTGKVVSENGGKISLKNSNGQYSYFKGRVFDSDGETESENVRVDRYSESTSWYCIGSALKSPSEFTGSAKPSMMNYDVSTGNFAEITTDGAFNDGHGSLAYLRLDYRYRQDGTIVNTSEPYTFSLNTENAYNRDFVYNPFPFPIPLDGKSAYFQNNESYQYLWLYVFSSSTNAIRYSIVDLNTGEYFNGGLFDEDLTDEYKSVLLPYEAFFIQAFDDQTGTEDFILDPTGVDISSYDVYGNPATSVDPSTTTLRLLLSSGEDYLSDEMALRFNGNGVRDTKTNYDGWKYANENYNSIYAIKGSQAITVANYPTIDELADVEEFPLGVSLVGSGTVTGTITARNIDNFDESVDVYLYDYQEGEEINLREQSYTFTATAGDTDNGRFYIRLKKQTTEETDPTALDDFTTSNDVRISTSGNNVLVTAKSASIGSDSYVVAYDLSGRQIARQPITSSSTTLSLGNYRGVAVVSATVSSQTTKARVIVK